MTNPINSLISAASGAAKAATTQSGPEIDKLKKVAKDFEAVFLRQMMASMRSASLGDGIFDSSATEQFQSMADGKTADAMAGKGVLGIADLLVKQFGARIAHNASTASATGATSTTTAPAAKDGTVS